jgi:hypothetical protein
MWITENTFIWVEDENTELEFDELLYNVAYQSATFTAASGETHDLVLAKIRNSGSLSPGVSSVFWHAVTASNCVKLKLERSSFGLCSLLALLQFLETSPSLELLELEGFAFKGDDCRTLATLERTGLEVTFEDYSFDAHGAKDAFIKWLRHSQVVTKLESCRMEDIIVYALSGNSSIKNFSLDAETSFISDYHIRSLTRALPGNLGIGILRVHSPCTETWSLLLRSL